MQRVLCMAGEIFKYCFHQCCPTHCTQATGVFFQSEKYELMLPSSLKQRSESYQSDLNGILYGRPIFKPKRERNYSSLVEDIEKSCHLSQTYAEMKLFNKKYSHLLKHCPLYSNMYFVLQQKFNNYLTAMHYFSCHAT